MANSEEIFILAKSREDAKKRECLHMLWLALRDRYIGEGKKAAGHDSHIRAAEH